jgi:hypothetical protein
LHVHVIPRFRGDMDDPRGGVRHVIPSKGNYLASPQGPASAPGVCSSHGVELVGGRAPLGPRLLEDLDRAVSADLAVAFILPSGLRGNVLPRLRDMLRREGAPVRILTGDYQDVTDPLALRELLLLQEEVRSLGSRVGWRPASLRRSAGGAQITALRNTQAVARVEVSIHSFVTRASAKSRRGRVLLWWSRMIPNLTQLIANDESQQLDQKSLRAAGGGFRATRMAAGCRLRQRHCLALHGVVQNGVLCCNCDGFDMALPQVDPCANDTYPMRLHGMCYVL